MIDIENCAMLAVVGGDGTLHEVVQVARTYAPSALPGNLCAAHRCGCLCERQRLLHQLQLDTCINSTMLSATSNPAVSLVLMTVLCPLQGLVRHLNPEALKLPLCHVPSGSGNGIAASTGVWTPQHAALAIIKGNVCPMDAATVMQPRSGTRRLAILSISFGMLTDLDLGTEHLRKLLGGERFTYGAVREVGKWSSHRACVAAYNSEEAAAAEVVPENTKVGEGEGRCALHNPDSWPYC
jgi:diacylglycerol kinase family enzyme